MMAQYRKRWKLVPLLILPPVIFFLLGIQWAILSLGAITLLLVVWDLIYVNFLSEEARKLREIGKHMTLVEREHMHKLAWNSRGGLIWEVLVGFLGISGCFVLGGILNIEDWNQPFPLAYYILALLVLFALEMRIALAPRWRKTINEFYFSTRYAKDKGWSEAMKHTE